MLSYTQNSLLLILGILVFILITHYGFITYNVLYEENTKENTWSNPIDESDVFSSVRGMEALVHQEESLIKTLTEYIRPGDNNHEPIKMKLEELSRARPPELSIEDITGDPISAYCLVRRLTRDWPFILNSIVNITRNGREMLDELPLLPREPFLEAAKRSIIRLQEVYRLDTKQLSHKTGNAKLTALDCFELGKYALTKKKFNISAQWLREASEKDVHERNAVGGDKILPYLFLAEFFIGCDNGTRSAGDTEDLQDAMAKYGYHDWDPDIAPLFEAALSIGIECPYSDSKLTKEQGHNKIWAEEFNRVCRGENTSSTADLRCFYIHHNNPRLLIAPFKMEEQNLNPPILMFHDVITDQEITDMKAEFSKTRRRCVTENRYPLHRLCELGWVEDAFSPTSARLTQRVGDITNLNMETSEPHQVASYGLGGAYLPHTDPFTNKTLISRVQGQRIATFMFYLNDVDGGGYTAFDVLNVAVKPKKGSAVFWFNINHESETIHLLFHGGCPVLRGAKWVINKWIREGKQTSDMFCPADKKFPKPRYYLDGTN